MNITYIRITQLPLLSWLADTNLDKGIARVFHGGGLEARPDFFIEGTWNGLFEKGAFDQTECIFGSGAVVRDDSLVFVSSATTTDGLFYRKISSRLVVSNSLPFILAYTEDQLDCDYREYHTVTESILNGINKYQRHFYTEKAGVQSLYFRNLEVTRSRFREIDKPLPPPFQSYHNYYDYLVKSYELIVGNVRSSERVHKLNICSTQSKGYDTTAINSIASMFGIDRVFSCTKSKGKGAYANMDRDSQQDDDGSEICAVLGLSYTPIDRRAYEKGFKDEYLYYASQPKNQDANFLEIIDRIKPISILITGTLGEIWYTGRCARSGGYYIDSDLRRWDLGCHGLSEVRLKAGFIQLAFPYIGAQRRVDIQKISDSQEMEPWRLNNDYDRPIPRRIAEERGVPRSLFGQTKLAAVVEFAPPRIPQNGLLRNEYFSFLLENGIVGRVKIALLPLIQAINTMISFKFTRKYHFIYFMERFISRIIRKGYTFPLIWTNLESSLFCFCVNKRIKDYKAAFDE